MKFNWEGDLEDDCFCKIDGFVAHCECLCDTLLVTDQDPDSPDPPFRIESWFVGVYRDYVPPAKDTDVLFHSGEYGGMITSSEMARAIAEGILRGYVSPQEGKI